MDEIQPRHWAAVADASGLVHLRQTMRELADGVAPAIARVESLLPPDYPERVRTCVTDGLREQALAFLRGFALRENA